MIPHPLFLAVLLCDLAAALLLLFAAFGAAKLLSYWESGSSSRLQLRLERQAEIAELAGRFATGLFVLGTLILTLLFASVLPELVPGAMCGTGVVQASGGTAQRAFGLRLLALVLLGLWRLMAGINRSAPLSPGVESVARLTLLATPIVVLAGLDSWRTMTALDLHSPVDCCSLVYEQFAQPAQEGARFATSEGLWSMLSMIGAVLLPLLLLACWRRPGPLSEYSLAGLSLLWAPIAALALVQVWSAYHYGVLEHHCPWCLFLAQHRFVGYPLLLGLWLVFFEGLALAVAAALGRSRAEFRAAATKRRRRAAYAVLLGWMLYLLLALAPAFVWRIQHGVWMHG
ncbi:MAG: hypothetical protein CSA62_08285 [Planctomycetota bacterium]|nr:MAG: hypothetical protein CSA62_08285 [Planctomycetota bacterium]